MGFGYHDHRIIRDGEAPELERRHLYARLLWEANSQRPPRRSLMARIAEALPRGRRNGRVRANTPSRMQTTIAAAAMAFPVAGLASGSADLGAAAAVDSTRTEPSGPVEVMREMTDAICRLPDGSIGHIAIDRTSDADWTAICVATPDLSIEVTLPDRS